MTSPSSAALPRVASAARHRNGRALNAPWSWLFSIRFGIVLLTILVVASIAGTLFEELEQAQAVIYYTWWYKLLLVLLAVNMGCATVRNIATKVMHAYRPTFQHQRYFYENASPSASLPFEGSAEDVARQMRSAGFHVDVQENAGYARQGVWGLWGAPLSHIGLILVLAGGFLASWVAQEGYVQILEGHRTDTMKLRRPGAEPVEHPLGFVLSLDDFDTDMFPQTKVPAYFRSTITAFEEGERVRTELVEVNTSPRIGLWNIHQTSYQAIPQLPRYELEVRHEDAATSTILEMSPGQIRPLPGEPGRFLRLNSANPLEWDMIYDGVIVYKSAPQHTAEGGEVKLVAMRFEPDFVMGIDRQITSRSEELNNPALLVAVDKGDGKGQTQWLFGSERLKGMMHSTEGDYALDLKSVSGEAGDWTFTVAVNERASGTPVGVFEMKRGESVTLRAASSTMACCPEEHDSAESTEGPWSIGVARMVEGHMSVLSLSRNPLIPFIYFGCALMMIGLLVGFFVARRRLWFVVDPKKGMLHVAAVYRFRGERFDHRTRALLKSLERPRPTEA